MNKRITPENITQLKNNEVFVFGSNESGFHGAGAALTAKVRFKAPSTKGFGFHKVITSDKLYQTFAIPTKDWKISRLDLSIIQFYVWRFIAFARNEYQCNFLVTEIGCGLAGYEPEDIAPLFREAINIENIYLPQRFWDVLNKN